MNLKTFRFLLYTFVGMFCVSGADAATSLFSNYGQIQNVQNYSTNPFWTPNSPYNKKLPQPVYVQGADLKAEDCINVVQSLVSVQCMVRDNCKNTSLADIRPYVMIQLSNLPGANYVSACSGYIDSIYEKYIEFYSDTVPSVPVAFPEPTTPNPKTVTSEVVSFPTVPEWKQEMNERAAELQFLEQENAN